jgi:hypothetical protein
LEHSQLLALHVLLLAAQVFQLRRLMANQLGLLCHLLRHLPEHLDQVEGRQVLRPHSGLSKSEIFRIDLHVICMLTITSAADNTSRFGGGFLRRRG